MYYPAPDRYSVYDRRPPPTRMPVQYSYGYPVHQYAMPQTMPPPVARQLYGPPIQEFTRMHHAEPADHSEDLLDRLEQAGRVPSKDKFRRMACMTYICTGACPYGDRCVFLHDYRIKAENAKVRTTRQMKANNLIKDTFYWPDMTKRDICRYLDAQGLPDANQRYIIPESFASSMSSFHNRGLYSVWNHFAEFCVHNSRLQEERRPIERDNFFQVSNYVGNRHIFGTYRLKIFVQLSMMVEQQGGDKLLDTSFKSGITACSGDSLTSPLDLRISPGARSTPVTTPVKPVPGSRRTTLQITADTPLWTSQRKNDEYINLDLDLGLDLENDTFSSTPLAGVKTDATERERSNAIAAPRSQLFSSTPDLNTSGSTHRSPYVDFPAATISLGASTPDMFIPTPALSPIGRSPLRPCVLFSVPEGEEEEEEDIEMDLEIITNTRVNFLMSSSFSPGQDEVLLPSPRAAAGLSKTVAWADAHRAKLEHWEGDAVENEEAEEEEEALEGSTSTLSGDFDLFSEMVGVVEDSALEVDQDEDDAAWLQSQQQRASGLGSILTTTSTFDLPALAVSDRTEDLRARDDRVDTGRSSTSSHVRLEGMDVLQWLEAEEELEHPEEFPELRALADSWNKL